jgi:uncharacterized protein YraI
MKKFVLLAAAAVCFAPAMISSASAATASVNVRVGSPGYYHSGYRAYNQRVVVSGSHCRMVTVRTKRANGSVWVRKIRKCG